MLRKLHWFLMVISISLIADAFGLDSMIGSNGESGIGGAAQLQVACAMPGFSPRFPSEVIGEFYYLHAFLDVVLYNNDETIRLSDELGPGVKLREELQVKFSYITLFISLFDRNLASYAVAHA